MDNQPDISEVDQTAFVSANDNIGMSDGEDIVHEHVTNVSSYTTRRLDSYDNYHGNSYNGNESATAETLANELAGYKRRVDVSVEEQHKNSETIAQLQNKLLAYRKRVSDLESKLGAEFGGSPGKIRKGLNFGNLEDTEGYMWDGLPDATSTPMKGANVRDMSSGHRSAFAESELIATVEELEEEKMRNGDLKRMHQRVRDELQAASLANNSLIQDVQRLNAEKEQTLTILATEKKKWTNYDTTLRDYLGKEHKKLLDLWGALQHLKREMSNAKSATRSDLESLQTEMHKSTQNSIMACQKFGLTQLTKTLQGDTNANSELLSAANSGSLETVLAESLRRLNDTQRDSVNLKSEMNIKLRDVQNKNSQLEEDLSDSRKTLSDLTTRLRRAEQTATDSDAAFWRLTQLSDGHTSRTDDSPDGAAMSRRARSLSPQGAAATRDAAVRSVKRALRSKQETMHDLEIQMKQSQQQAEAAKRQTQLVEERRRALERQLIEAEEVKTQLANDKEESTKKLERTRLQLKQLQLDKESVEKSRTGLTQDFKQLNHEHQTTLAKLNELEKLRDEAKANEQRMGDQLERIKIDLNQRLDHANKDCNRLKSDLTHMNTELNIALDDKSSMDSKFNENSNLRRKIEEENEQLRTQIHQAHNDCKTLQSDSQRFKKELDLALNRTSTLENQVKTAENEISDISRAKRGLIQENEQLKVHIQNKDRLLLDADAAKEASMKEADRYQFNMETMQKDLDKFKTQVSEIETQLRLETQSKRSIEEKLYKLEEENTKYSEIVETITTEKHEIIKERSKLSDKIGEIQMNFDEENGQVKTLKEELRKLQDINSELQTMIDNRHREKLELNSKLDDLNRQIDNLRDSLENETDLRRRAEEELNVTKIMWNGKLTDAEKDWNLKFAELKAKHSHDLELILNDKESERSDYERRLEELRRTMELERDSLVQKMKEEINELERQIKNQQNDHMDKITDMETKFDRIQSDLRSQLDAVRRQMSESEEDAKDAKLRAADSEENCRDAEKRLAQAMQDVHFWKSKADEIEAELNAQLARLKTELETATTELEASENQVSNLNSQLSTEIGRATRYKKEMEDLREILNEKSVTVDNLQRELDELKSMMQEKDGQLQTATLKSRDAMNRINELESKLSNANFDLDSFAKNLRTLESQKSQLEHELSLQNQKYFDLEERMKTLKQDWESIREERDILESSVRNEQDEMSRLKSSLNSKEVMIEQMVNDLQNARQQLADAVLDRETADSDRNSLASQLTSIKENLERKDSEYKNVIDELKLSVQKAENSKIFSEKRVIEISSKLEEAENNSHSSDNNLLAIKAQWQKLIDQRKDAEEKLSSLSSVARRLLLRVRPGTPGVQGLQRVASGLEADISSMQLPSLDTSVVQDGRLEDGLSACVSTWDSLLKDRSTLMQELESTQRRLTEAETARSAARRELQNMQASLADADGERSALTTRLASSQALLISQEETLRSRDDDRRQMKAQLTEIEKLLNLKDEKLRTLNESLELTQQDLDATVANERQLRIYEETWDGERSQIEDRLRDTEQALQRERLTSSQAQGERESLVNRLSDLESQLRLSETRLNASQSSVDQLRKHMSKSEEDETQLRSQLDSMSRNVADNQGLQDQLTRANIELQNAHTTKLQMRADLDATRQTLDDWKTRTADLNGRLVELERRLNQTSEANKEVQLQLNIANKAIESRESTIADLRRQLDDGDSQRRTALHKANDAQLKLESVLKEKQEWNNLKLRWEREISKLSRAVDELSGEKRRTKDAMQHAVKEKDSLEKALNSLEEENRILHNAVQKLQSQIMDLEQGHARRLVSITNQQRTQAEQIVERLRHEKMALERRLQMQEKGYYDKRRGLESEIKDLRDSLKREVNRRKEFVTKFSHSSRDIANIHQGLNQSVSHISALSGDQPLLDDLASRARISETSRVVSSRLSFENPMATSSPYISPIKDGLSEK